MAHHVRDPSSLWKSLYSAAALKNILNKLAKDVSDEFESSSTPFPKDDLHKLKKTVSSISDALPDIEELAINAEVDDLVLHLTEVAYDIEDLLDEAATQRLMKTVSVIKSEVQDSVLDLTEVATQRLMIVEKKVSGIKDWFPGINIPWKPRRDFASDLKIQIRLLDEIAAKLSYSSSMKNQPDVPNPTFFTETRAALEISSNNQKVVGSEETIIGREEDKERLIHCILSPSSSTQHPVVINVTGDGGIGKTTLVKLVCNDSRVSSSFDLVSWASYDGSLSYAYGLERLTSEIDASAIWKGDVKRQGISSYRLAGVFSILRGRKFLLVVDGIKHELLPEWKQYLGFLMVGSEGSTVILISWSSIDIRGSMKIFKLERILERECWSLFKRISAFDENLEQADPSLNDIGRSIVKKCGGSPLAVKTLASLLQNNKDRHYWEQILQSKLWGQCNEAWVSWFIRLQRVPVELIPSYLAFFTATDIFDLPVIIGSGTFTDERDDSFESKANQLVWFWMAQGLLQSTKESDDLIEIGRRFCKELESMSFLPLAPESMSFLPLAPRDPRLCLLEHDFAKCLSEKQTGHVNDRLLPSTTVSLQSKEDMSLQYKSAKVSSTSTWKARTVALSDSRLESMSKPLLEGVLSNFKHLRVLSIHTGRFRWSVELPESIGNLKLLRYLSLTSLSLLDHSVCKLVNLQTLHLSSCFWPATLPMNMHKLVSMRHLLLSGCDLLNLKSLTSLHHLQISVRGILPPLFGKGLQYQTVLRTLKIHDCPNVTSLPNSINCLSSLKELSIINFDKLDLIGWEGLFDLRSLKSLRIQGLPLLSELPDGLQSSADSLEHFVISNCVNLRALPESLERCTRLVDIIIECCPELIALPQGIHALKNLQVLKILDCPHLVETVTGNDWHLISHVPIIYLDGEVRRNMDTSTVQQRPGPPNLSPSKEIRPASTTSPGEIVPIHEDQSSYLSDYDHPPSPIQSYSVQSQYSALPTAEHPQAAPTEHSGASPPYGMNINVESTLIPVTHHAGSDAPDSENQDTNKASFREQVVEVEMEVEGKQYQYSASRALQDELHNNVISSSNSESPLRRILFLFADGYEFEKEMLIQLWMALEPLTDEHMDEIGAKHFDDLVLEGYISRSVANSRYKVNTEKLVNTAGSNMAEDMKNYAILDNESRRGDTSQNTPWHISVTSDGNEETIFKQLTSNKELKAFLFLGNYGSTLQRVPADFFLYHQSLLALDLSGTHVTEMPSCAMISLRYLDLSRSFIELLPERTAYFQKLQTLKLKGCSRLHRLPNGMKSLTKLRHLDLDVLEQLVSFPKGMGALEDLRTLSAFPVGIAEGLKITELKKLNKLKGEFCIAKLENVQSADEAKEASLSTKTYIRKLMLRWSDYQCDEPKNEDESILNSLRPNTNLEEIQIVCYHGTNLPSWITDLSLTKLVSITLFKCEHVSVLPSLEKLPTLEALKLISLNSVTKMDYRGEKDHVAFPKLRKLVVDVMLNMESWTKAEEGDYPCLIELSIRDCPKLTELSILPYLRCIEDFEVSGCTKLTFVLEKKMPSSLKQLIVEDCPLIKERCSKKRGQDWRKIRHVPTIRIDQVVIQTNKSSTQPYEDDQDGDQGPSKLQNPDNESARGKVHERTPERKSPRGFCCCRPFEGCFSEVE